MLVNDNASGGTLKFWLQHTSQFSNATFRERLILDIGTASFNGSAATYSTGINSVNSIFTWTSSGLTWAASQSIMVSLTLKVPGIDSIAFNSAGADNTFDTGEGVTATVTFDEAVTVTGTPQLTIKVGSADKVLSYASGSGTTALVFTGYTVAFGDTDTDGISIEANKLDLNGGTIKATADAHPAAVLDHTAVAASASHTVSGVQALMVPHALTNFSVTTHATTTPGSIQFSAFRGGGPTVSSYEFRASTDSGVNWNHAVTDDWPDTTLDSKGKQLLAGLTPGTAYTFELRGRNADGYGPAVQATGTTAGAVSITGVALTSSPATGTTYYAGEDVTATLTFSRPVTVRAVSGNRPQLELDFNGTAKLASCPDVTQSMTVACTYTVVVGDAASSGVAIAANKLTRTDNAELQMGADSSANVDYTVPLAHTALAADTDHKVSGTTVPAGPTVDSIEFNSAGSDGAFKTGDAVTATVTFDESVTVDTTDGTPQLTIKMGGTDKVLDYSSGSPGTALVFSGYTVAANDEDADGLSIEANKLSANGGTIQKTADTSVAAVLTHAAVAASANHKVDGVKPTLVTTGDDAPKTTLDGSKIILVFSENIFTLDRTKITVKEGTTTLTTSGSSSNGPRVELTLTTALAATATNITVALAADAVTDVPGNGIAAVSATSVTRTLPPGKPTLTLAAKNQSIDATVVFSAHGTSDITKYQYRTKTTGSYGSWTDSTDDVSNTGGTFTIGSLTNGTEYTVQVRGVNSDGEGAESDAKAATPDAPPAVSSVAITSTPATANTYIIGEDVEFTVTFDKDLTLAGSDTSRSPATLLWLLDYATDRPGVDDPEADCAIGTNTKTLVCSRTVEEGWYDNDGIAIGANAVVQFRPITFVVGPLGQQANDDHSARPIDSDHKVDGIRPTLSRADADPNDLTKIILTFSEVIKDPVTTKFTVEKGGVTQTTTGAPQIDPATRQKVTLTLDTALLSTDTDVTVNLGADAVKDVPGNGIAEVLGMSVSVEDNVAPTLESAQVIAGSPRSVVLIFDEALASGSTPATSRFTVKVEGNSRTPSSVSRPVGMPKRISLTLGPTQGIRPGETVTVSYTKPGTNPLKDAADNEVESFTDEAVANNLAATAPDAPGNLEATATHADRVTLTWDTPWDNGSAITRFEYRAGEGGTVPPSIGWTAIADSGPTTTEVAVAALNWGTQHAFEVRAVNDEGNGNEATVSAETLLPTWSFTLRDASNNDVTELTEGGATATATVSIANNVRFGADQTVQLKWGGLTLGPGDLIQGAGGVSTITILAGPRPDRRPCLRAHRSHRGVGPAPVGWRDRISGGSCRGGPGVGRGAACQGGAHRMALSRLAGGRAALAARPGAGRPHRPRGARTGARTGDLAGPCRPVPGGGDRGAGPALAGRVPGVRAGRARSGRQVRRCRTGRHAGASNGHRYAGGRARRGAGAVGSGPRPAARLHRDHARHAIGEVLQELRPGQLQIHDLAGLHIDPVQLEHALRRIHPDDGSASLHLGPSGLPVKSLLFHLGTLMPSAREGPLSPPDLEHQGVGGVHPISPNAGERPAHASLLLQRRRRSGGPSRGGTPGRLQKGGRRGCAGPSREGGSEGMTADR